jgi:hypothetical protein
MRVILLLTLGLLGSQACQLHAQRLDQFRFPTIDTADRELPVTARLNPSTPRDEALLAMGGVLGGAAGLFGGAIVGAKLTEDDCDDCGIVGLVYGGIAGGSALLPLGVHVSNGRRGDYGKSLLASLALGAAGVALSHATDEWAIMLAVPVAQLVSSIAIEPGTSRVAEDHPRAERSITAQP